jgi:uncharacterized membrane protein
MERSDGTLRPLKWAGFLVGISLGGFFDGILLHQILQWHHLLSNVQALQDMRTQVLADGLFHALMYVIALVALYKLWRAREVFSSPGADTLLWAMALVGFGAWHVLDSVLSHWLTGIHRIKSDSPNPLAWDILWFVAFGLVPLWLGWVIKRRRASNSGGGGRAAGTLALAALVGGPIAAMPSGDPSQVMVLFAPGISASAAFQALGDVDARVLWGDKSGGLWAVQMPDPGKSSSLYRRGALLVSNSSVAFGCFSWSKAL